MRLRTHVQWPAIAAALLVASSQAGPSAQAQGEAFSATASVKTRAGAQVTAPVTIVITRLSTDQERAAVVTALKTGGTAEVVWALKKMPDIGYIDLGERRTPLKYAQTRPLSGGRLITVVAPTPIVYLGAGLPDAKPKVGFDLSLAVFQANDAGGGSGELVPAGTIKLDANGAVQTQDYGAEGIQLTNVQRKK